MPLVLMAVIPGCSCEPAAVVVEGELRGRVVSASADGVAPVEGAAVFLEGSARSVRTNVQGNFSLRGLPEGAWTLRIFKTASEGCCRGGAASAWCSPRGRV
ncbi:MAG: carboxypeptidase regulatory-like domain-containing protein [Deltaproteobacteria bacterium]|nr:carboxypeptidase regulatory-like domain-containing protein [Deltaproteobacteria bacterium]